MKNTEIKFNLDGLEKFRSEIGDKYRTRIGFVGSKGGEDHDGLTNAELALIHMFGSLSRNIPGRDMLLMPIERNKRELIQALGSTAVKTAFEAGDFKKVMALMGVKAEQFVQEAFDTGGFGLWTPLSPKTIKAKGSSAILIHFGQLRRAVSSDVVTKGSVNP